LDLFDNSGSDHITMENGLDFFDDSFLDSLLYDGLVNDLSSLGSVNIDHRLGSVEYWNCSSTGFDGSDLSGKHLLLNESGCDLSLMKMFSESLDLSLLSFSVDDGLDFLLFDGVEVLLNDDGTHHLLYLDGCRDGGDMSGSASDDWCNWDASALHGGHDGSSGSGQVSLVLVLLVDVGVIVVRTWDNSGVTVHNTS
jgi:hypothetical protein